jgi:hypothetical protein
MSQEEMTGKLLAGGPVAADAFQQIVTTPVMGGVTYSGTVNVVDPEEFARRTVARQRDAAAVAGLTSILCDCPTRRAGPKHEARSHSPRSAKMSGKALGRMA